MQVVQIVENPENQVTIEDAIVKFNEGEGRFQFVSISVSIGRVYKMHQKPIGDVVWLTNGGLLVDLGWETKGKAIESMLAIKDIVLIVSFDDYLTIMQGDYMKILKRLGL